jgi:hypothetical protein
MNVADLLPHCLKETHTTRERESENDVMTATTQSPRLSREKCALFNYMSEEFFKRFIPEELSRNNTSGHPFHRTRREKL